jgi:hypothetical protein
MQVVLQHACIRHKPVSMQYVKQGKARLSASPESVPLHRSAASFHVS